MTTCPTCKGAKRITVKCVTIEKGAATESSLEMDCHICEGKGVVTPAFAAAIRRASEAWCGCGNPSGDVSHHPDRRGVKHHWTCDDCDKIVQVG